MKPLLLILWLISSPAWATITLVQKSADAGSSGTSPYTVTLSNTAAGNPIVVTAFFNGGGATASVSDGVNTYASTTLCANGNNHVQEFYVLSGAGNVGTLTISISASPISSVYANAREYHGSGSFTLDASACTTTPASTATPTSDTVATSGNDLLVGGMIDFNAISGGCGTGWVDCATNTNQGAIVTVAEDKLNQTAGNYATAFTLGGAQSDWMASILALKEAASVGPNVSFKGKVGMTGKVGTK